MKMTSMVVLSGVYFLFDRGSLIYIGQSNNIHQRLLAHMQEKVFDEVHFISCEDAGERISMETAFIKALRTPWNTCGVAVRAQADADRPKSAFDLEKTRSAPDAPVAVAPGAMLTQKQVCDRYGVSPRTAMRWRSEGGGPAYVRLGSRRIGYLGSALLAWEAERGYAHRAAELVGVKVKPGQVPQEVPLVTKRFRLVTSESAYS